MTVSAARQRRSLGELQSLFRELTAVDADRWRRDLREADEVFGADELVADPWTNGTAE